MGSSLRDGRRWRLQGGLAKAMLGKTWEKFLSHQLLTKGNINEAAEQEQNWLMYVRHFAPYIALILCRVICNFDYLRFWKEASKIRLMG
jgi:hypothetical protein